MAWTRGACLLGILLLASCGSGRHSGTNPFQARSERELTIVVENRNFADATLHAVSTGRRVRLGVVTGQAGATYSIPWEGLRELHIEIALLAGSNYRTHGLTVSPGDRVDLVIDSTPGRATIRR